MYDDNSKKATIKYMKENRDKLTLNLPRGLKEQFKSYAKSQGKSLTSLIIQLIDDDMKNSGK